MSYGFSAYDKSSEIYFAKYTNSTILRPDKDKQLPNLSNIDYNFRPTTEALRNDPNSIKFTIPSDIIRHFKSNNIKPNFIPVVLKTSCTCVLNYAELYKSIDNWDWRSDITFYIRIVPLSLTAYFQRIMRTGDKEKVSAVMIVGFKE